MPKQTDYSRFSTTPLQGSDNTSQDHTQTSIDETALQALCTTS